MERSTKEISRKRRLASARMKTKAVRAAKINGIDPAKYIHIADNLQVCSGLCCGNRRQYEGRSLHEMRHLDSMQAAILDEVQRVTPRE